jgi:hypothetical protein
MAKDESSGIGAGGLVKGGLLVLGGLAALGIAISLLKPLLILGVLGGAGYIGYRLITKQKALEGKKQGALPASSDYERRMRELDDAERKLDAEIRRHGG